MNAHTPKNGINRYWSIPISLYIYIYVHLVGGIPTPLKNVKVSWDDESPNRWKNKNCLKPPTIYIYIYISMGGVHKWRYPTSWMIYFMERFGGNPMFRKPPYMVLKFYLLNMWDSLSFLTTRVSSPQVPGIFISGIRTALLHLFPQTVCGLLDLSEIHSVLVQTFPKFLDPWFIYMIYDSPLAAQGSFILEFAGLTTSGQ